MKDEQLAVIRDKLIAELPSPKFNACKYDGALHDWRLRNGLVPHGVIQDAPGMDLAKAEDEVRALVNAASDQAISYLSQELRRDAYKGKSYEDIQQILMQEVVQTRTVTPKEGDPYDIEVSRTPPPISRVWGGIPYTYNTPPLEVIQRALEL